MRCCGRRRGTLLILFTMDSLVRPDDSRLGTLLDKKYRLDRLLGVGGTGMVYAAWHLNLDRPVAVKILHPHFAAYPKLVERFQQEAQMMGLLGPTHVVQVLDFRCMADGVPYLVMELLAGETLRQRLRRGPLTIDQTLSLYEPLCEAIGQAHARGVVHRDLKPDNLMLAPADGGEGSGPVLKILDFGSSKLLDPSLPQSSVQLQAGTPYYTAPERIDSACGPADHRVDIFALGAILYEVLSGRMAFQGDSPMQAIFKILTDSVDPLALPDPRAGLLDAVIRRACARRPADRFSTAAELFAGLAAAAGGEALPAPSTAASAAGDPPPASGLSASGLPASGSLLGEPTDPTPRSTLSRPPLPPYVLAAPEPLGLGVKPVVLLALSQQARAELSPGSIEAALGAGWQSRLDRVVVTDWVDGAELRALLLLSASAGGAPALSRLGRAFADVALTTVYKSLLRPGVLAGLRRLGVMLRLWFGEGSSDVQEGCPAPGRHTVRVRGLRLLSAVPELVPVLAGFLQRYAELTGAAEASVEEWIKEADEVRYVVRIAASP